MITIKDKDELKNRNVFMVWEKSLHEKAKKFAKKKGVSLSEMVRQAVTIVMEED